MQLPVIGQVFEGQYRIESLLGEGGFGAVFLARDHAGREVALKVVKPDGGGTYSRNMRARFEREVGVLASLRSPHTVRMYTHGQASDGLLYVVFEYIAGRDLTEYLQAVGRLDAKWVEHVLRQILLALDEAHKGGLIHRDIKPDNIRVFEARGDPMTVKLLDFGIARATDDGHPSITKTGELIGTPRYMSPEQLKAQPLTPRSDIYSLGMVAIELLAGVDALPGVGVADQLGRLLSSDSIHAPQLRERAGPLLDVVQRMTALDPDDRFPSAAAVLAALDGQLVAGTPRYATPTRPPAGPSASTIQPIPSTPTTDGASRSSLGTLAVLLVLVVGAATVVVWLLGRDTGAEDRSVNPQKRDLAFLRGEQAAAPAPRSVESAPAAPDAGTTQVDLSGTDMFARRTPPGDAVPSEGCGKAFEPGRHVDAGGSLTYVPRGYDPNYPHPTIIVTRTDMQPPEALFSLSELAALADRERAIVLLPEDQNKRQVWRVWRETSDTAQVRGYYDQSRRELCIDRARVYMVGVGQGARVALRSTCVGQNWVTALAIHSYLPNADSTFEEFVSCKIRPLPVMWITPLNSWDVPARGGKGCDLFARHGTMSLETLEDLWSARYACEGEPRQRGAITQCREQTCEHPFVSCAVPGGAGWPGSHFSFRCPNEPAAANVPVERWLWDFFAETPPLEEPN